MVTITPLVGTPIPSTYTTGNGPNREVHTRTTQEMAKAATAQIINANQQHTITASGNAMKKEFGSGVSTIVTISNETAFDLELVPDLSYNWSGEVGKYPVSPIIGVGQTAVFLHVEDGIMTGSEGAVVFHVKQQASPHDGIWACLMWNSPFKADNTNTVLVENGHVGHWSSVESFQSSLEDGTGSSTTENLDVETSGSIGAASSPFCNFVIAYPS